MLLSVEVVVVLVSAVVVIWVVPATKVEVVVLATT